MCVLFYNNSRSFIYTSTISALDDNFRFRLLLVRFYAKSCLNYTNYKNPFQLRKLPALRELLILILETNLPRYRYETLYNIYIRISPQTCPFYLISYTVELLECSNQSLSFCRVSSSLCFLYITSIIVDSNLKNFSQQI